MTRSFPLTLVLVLTLLLVGPAVVEAKAASPALEGWSEAAMARVAAWLDVLQPPLEKATSTQETTENGNTYPNLDPDGLSGSTDPDTDSDAAGGNTYPNLDPNG